MFEIGAFLQIFFIIFKLEDVAPVCTESQLHELHLTWLVGKGEFWKRDE